MEHGLSTFVRLVRAVLGPTSISDNKVECGMALVILGIMVYRCHVFSVTCIMLSNVQVRSSELEVVFTICPKKRAKWLLQIQHALEADRLDAGSASKLAGRLNFATQRLFRRLGRAMVRPIYAQTSSTTGKIGARLRDALEWWLRVLTLEITECCPLGQHDEHNICKMLVDAASTPAHCAVVACIDGEIYYTDAAPSDRMVAQLQARRDKQITSLVCVFRRRMAPLCFAIYVVRKC